MLTISGWSRRFTEIRTPACWLFSTLYPAETRPLNSASCILAPRPSTSPVDFISGDRAALASVIFSKENTGTFTAT